MNTTRNREGVGPYHAAREARTGKTMTNYITRANPQILQGLLGDALEFDRHLNFLCGENGTLKTKILQALKSNQNVQMSERKPHVVLAFSPKRNAERRNFDQIVQTYRQQNKGWLTLMNERIQRPVNDSTFDTYASVGDLYIAAYEEAKKDGADQRAHMRTVADEFNGVVRDVFPEYSLRAEWNDTLGSPKLALVKREGVETPMEGLSTGEQEVLSLVLHLHTARDSYDVCLIDEPEVHLNWHLEERLFAFLERHAQKHDRQVIVATHSRAVFKQRFLPRVQFLVWRDGHVRVTREMADEQRRRIAGEAIEIVALGDFRSPTFFVEDSAHEEVVSALANRAGVRVTISPCGNASNVESLYRLSRTESGWHNAFFLRDGDNEGNPFPGDPKYIKLSKYAIENYFLDRKLMVATTSRTDADVRTAQFEALQEARSTLLRRNKFFDFLFQMLEPAHLDRVSLDSLDGALILDRVLKKLNVSRGEFIRESIAWAFAQGREEELMPADLVKALKALKAPRASAPGKGAETAAYIESPEEGSPQASL